MQTEQRNRYVPASVSAKLNTRHSYGSFVMMRKPVVILRDSLNLCFIQTVLVFTKCSFSVPGSHLSDLLTLGHHVSCGQWQFLGLPFFWMTFPVLKGVDQVFCRLCLNLDSSDVSLLMRAESWVWRRKATEGNCHSYHTTSRAEASA